MNLLLLCHGKLSEFASFELKKDQSVQYRGNFGTALSSSSARALVQALLDNPLVTDAEMASQIAGYAAQPALEGPRGFKPDIVLDGDDALLCFVMNMNTGRWTALNSGWNSKLAAVVDSFGVVPFWLNLLCCTTLGETNLQKAVVKPDLKVTSWADVLK